MNGKKTKKPEDFGFRENAMLRTSEVQIDKTYQRQINQRQVNKIAKNMDLRLFGRIEVDLRECGEYYVVDGMHRLRAAIQCGMTHVPCGVALSEGVESEAVEFVELNRTQRRVTGYDLFAARLTAKDPHAVEVDKIVQENGYELSNKQRKNSSNAAVSIEGVYKDYGADSLNYALATFCNAYGRNEKLQGFMVVAIGRFYGKLNARPNFNKERLAQVLKSIPITEIKRRTSERAGHGGVTAQVASYVLLEIYNKNLSAVNRQSFEDLR